MTDHDDGRKPTPLAQAIVPVVKACEPINRVMDDLREAMRDGWGELTLAEMMEDLRGDD